MPITARQRSIHIKNGPKRTQSFSKGKPLRKGSVGFRRFSKSVLGYNLGGNFVELAILCDTLGAFPGAWLLRLSEFLVTNAPSDLRGVWYPGGAAALVLLLTVRLTAAYTAIISDCDETYNYWEPLHYLVYGSGLQTWEYSPQYAIRSYAPLWLLAVPAKVLALVLRPVTVFYCLRALIAVLGACADLMFYKAVCQEWGVAVGRVWLLLWLPSAALWTTASALLPSAISGSLALAAIACWWRRRSKAAVTITAVNALLSWPFTALLGIPIAIDLVLVKRQILDFFKYSLTALVVILVPMVLALSCPLLLLACQAITPRAVSRAPFCTPSWLGLMPLVLWLGVFMVQPHKEERFLYPVYGLITLYGALALDCLQKMVFAIGTELFRWRRERERRHYLAYTTPLMVGAVLLAGALGVSRISAVHRNYHGPMRILSHLPPSPFGVSTVCCGKEWHRSPSSFHLPTNYTLRFISSEFKGQLPAPYHHAHNATRLIHPYFNDMNVGDNRTYVRPSRCQFLVDSDIGTPSKKQPAYHLDPNWEIVAQVPLLDAEKSHRVFRAFHIPGFSSSLTFANLYLLQNKRGL